MCSLDRSRLPEGAKEKEMFVCRLHASDCVYDSHALAGDKALSRCPLLESSVVGVKARKRERKDARE